MMRSHYHTLTTVATLVLMIALLTGCDSLLDTEPQQSIRSETALENETDLEAAVAGAYNQISDYDMYGGQLMMLPDLLADDGELFWGGTFEEPNQVFDKSILVDNAFVRDQWIDAYSAIGLANNILAAAEEIEAAGTPISDAIRGQAHFVRGVMHFELVRLFARTYTDGDPSENLGVPIILEPATTLDDITSPERSTVEQVYNAVISDLTTARDLLPDDSDRQYADTFVASAMLSRVYLMQENFEGARDEADRVIRSGKYALASLYEQAFNQSTDPAEYVFSIQISVQDNGNHSLGVFYDAQDPDPEGSGRGDIDILGAHVDLYSADDQRGEFFYIDQTFGLRYTSKWRAPNTSNIPVIRLSEMYLTRAEANLRLGTEIGNPPSTDVNIVRDRASADPIPAADLTVDDILFERVLELSFEGHRLHDLKRTQRSVGSIPFDDPSLVYPIPQRELDANPNITQNPGYGS